MSIERPKIKLSHIEKLDEVLFTLGEFDSRVTYDGLLKIIETRRFDISNQTVMLILEKLKKDGFGEVMLPTPGLPESITAILTFEGRVFVEQGGYKQKQLDQNAEKNRVEKLETSQRELMKRLNFLTGWVAFGTVALALIELLSITLEYHWFSF
jgi:hypothetical protein